MSGRVAAVALAALAAASGCAGAQVAVTAERAHYPISMSAFVRDDRGEIVPPYVLAKVGDLVAEKTRVGLLYSTVTPLSTYDVSDEVNAQVAAAGGEAVTNFAVTVSSSCAVLNEFPLLGILPFWPGCVPVRITGDIVRRTVMPVRAGPPAPAAGPRPPGT